VNAVFKVTTLPENVNVPGDGRFDQSIIPGTVVLQLGRVDFFDLPAFAPRTETDLLRQYLDKDHNFRHKAFTVEERCLVNDYLGPQVGLDFAASAWRSCAPMFGPARMVEQKQDWLKTLCSEGALWAYASAGSERTHCGGIVSTKELVDADPKAVFLLLFGSYFGDWNVRDNLMRAALGTRTCTLTCAWSGMPQLDFHAMALGETAGYGIQYSQRLDTAVGPRAGHVHIALMGDPTLRMHVVAPVKELEAAATRG
jgi:hypothetical protein